MKGRAVTADIDTAARPLAATRRGLIVAAALTGGSLLVGCSPADVLSLGVRKPDIGAFGAFIRIDPDGAVTVVNKHLEMGQGSHTALAAMIAEELDADWDKVKVVAAPADAKVYANSMFGVQGTGGSTAVNNAWTQYRTAGAAARAMFLTAAANRWAVPARDITVRNGIVAHIGSGRSAGFGELLADAGRVTPPQAPTLKRPQDFTLIGTDRIRRKDSTAKTTGAERFTQDVHLPDMLTAMVAHAPRFGAKVASFDDAAARKIPGVVDVVQIPTGVAVIAGDTHAARVGRDALVVQWDDSKAERRSSDQILADYKRIAAGSGDLKPQVFQTAGDATSAFQGPLFEAAYDVPYLAHAAMEPMNCVAQVNGG